MPTERPIFVQPYPLGPISDQSGNAVAGFPPSNLGLFDHIGMVYRSSTSGVANPQIRGDFGSARPVDFFAMLNTNATPSTQAYLILSTADIQSGTQYNTGVQLIVNPTMTSANGLYHLHFQLPSVQTFRYWAFYIYNHTGPFECSTLILGKKIQLANFYTGDYRRGVQDMGEIDFGRYGVPGKTPGIVMRKAGFTLPWVTGPEYEEQVEPMLQAVGTRTPIYMCFDPEATAYRQRKTYFGWLREPPFATGALLPGTLAQEFEILSQI
jgi:hypothetical protein